MKFFKPWQFIQNIVDKNDGNMELLQTISVMNIGNEHKCRKTEKSALF